MSGPEFRPLPAHPDLESERKRAKQLLREARRGDPHALARVAAQNRSLAGAVPASLRLADAQLTLAREYGFKSWPLLVEYFETYDRQLKSDLRHHYYRSDFYKGWPRTLLHEHAERRHWAAVSLGAAVPRLFGLTLEEIFATKITQAEAELASARTYGYVSWEELLRDADRRVPPQGTDAAKPRREMSRAMRAGDLEVLRKVVAEYPELVGVDSNGDNIIADSTLYFHYGKPDPASRAIVDWVSSLGVDLQKELNRKLLGGIHMSTEAVDRLLGMGADPAWIAPNGYSVLEHAIHRYWNGEAVDRIAARAKAPDSFWVAAGLGDVKKLRKYFDRNGRLTKTARTTRPDLSALGRHSHPHLALVDDITLLFEAAVAATTNGRGEALDVLIEHGYPIDYCPGMTLLSFAVGNGLADMVELLVKRGASPHVRGWRPNMTAFEIAVDRYASQPDDLNARRIVELCGGDANRIRAEAEAKREPPKASKAVEIACRSASGDARRQGRTSVGIENVAVALLKDATNLDFSIFEQGRTTVDQVRALVTDRIAALEPEPDPTLLADAELRHAMDAAVRTVAERRESIVTPTHLWIELLVDDQNAAAQLIRRAGGDPAVIRKRYQAIYEKPGPRPPFR